MDFTERQNCIISVGICCTNILILLEYRKKWCSNWLMAEMKWISLQKWNSAVVVTVLIGTVDTMFGWFLFGVFYRLFTLWIFASLFFDLLLFAQSYWHLTSDKWYTWTLFFTFAIIYILRHKRYTSPFASNIS